MDTAKRNEIKRKLQREQRRLTLRKALRNRLAMIGGTLTLLIILVALLAPFISPADPYTMSVQERLTAPGAKYPLGSDAYGRDVMTRIFYGAQVSMKIGASVGLTSMVLGMVIGLTACYYKPLDNLLMRICDGLSAIPSTLLAIALMAVMGSSITNVIISLSVVNTPRMARVVRSAALVIMEQTYIEAMHALGAPAWRIIFFHVAPNVLSPAVVQTSYIFANAVITEAALSFLGVGVPVPNPSWGNILYEGKTVITQAWWLIVFPGIFTAASVLGLNLFGDGLRDILDPHTN